ncbi:MAG: calcium-binding protein [Limimaricola soesokkakensis]|uniref:calcium-binding protein n=1 Tax=Limimaricola soesokkakensis TaxID=1343159 RepID=UPI0040592C59
MAHLDSSYGSFETFLRGSEGTWAVDLTALNNSGVYGSAIVSLGQAEDTPYINVAILAENLTPDMAHAQHIHGVFDDEGNPANSRTPTLPDDADGDGFVEVLEGVPAYGDILLSLTGADGMSPMADSQGQLSYIQSFDLTDMDNLKSPVTDRQYDMEDLMPLVLREIVLHGQNVDGGYGEGTDGEINGEQDGYVGILPVAAGEIMEIDLEQALDLLAGQRASASGKFGLSASDDVFNAGAGDDVVKGFKGNDVLDGGADNDVLRGFAGDDRLDGGTGNDLLAGGAGADVLAGGKGNDTLNGKAGADILIGNQQRDTLNGGAGDDRLLGNLGRDTLDGGDGADILNGGRHNDVLTGGDGADIFAFRSQRDGDDIITDFEDGSDLLDFTRTSLEFEDLTIENQGDDAVISYGDSQITLLGIDAGAIDRDDFLI